MEKQNSTLLRLSSIKEIAFNHNWSDEATLNIDMDNLDVYYRTSTIIYATTNTIITNVGVRYSIADFELVQLDISLNYDVLNLSECMTINEERHELSFKNDILPTLISTAIGTLRGVLYSKTAGTKLEKFPLPMVIVQNVMKNNQLTIIDN